MLSEKFITAFVSSKASAEIFSNLKLKVIADPSDG